MSLQVGLALPSFVHDIEVPISMAVQAEAAGVSGVFAYDHMFRLAGDASRRPAIECFALMTAVAIETDAVSVGSLVIRSSLRSPALVGASLRTVRAVADERLIVGIGAGDAESVPEHEALGIPFPSLDDRLRLLRSTGTEAQRFAQQVWIGGTHPRVREVAAAIGGWNAWGVEAGQFAAWTKELTDTNPHATATWGGLVVFGDTDAEARRRAESLNAGPSTLVGSPATVAAHLGAYERAGASYAVLAAVDAANAMNAQWCGEVQRLCHLAKGSL